MPRGKIVGILYILSSSKFQQIKIGITNSEITLKARLRSLGGLDRIDLGASYFFNCKRPRVIERFLHFSFEQYKIPSEKAFVRDWLTECFYKIILSDVLVFLNEQNTVIPVKIELNRGLKKRLLK